MKKHLTDMTLEELWQLFPIILTEPNPSWTQWYTDEVETLRAVLPDKVKYHHVGSTAIKGIWAKPIVDILIVVSSREQTAQCAEIMREQGYIMMSASDSRVSLNKGYNDDGFAVKVFHLHIRLANDVDEIYFRDYLNAHPDVAKEYEALKLRLAKIYEHNRDAYTAAKTEFVTKYTHIAKRN